MNLKICDILLRISIINELKQYTNRYFEIKLNENYMVWG